VRLFLLPLSMTERAYQDDLIERTSAALREGYRAPLIQLPTGGGKTHIAIKVIKRALARGKRVLFQAHTRTLVKQTLAKFEANGLDAGVIMAGFPRSSGPLQIGSVWTVARRLNQIEPFDLIVSDEAHRAPSASFRAALTAWPRAYHLGLTATPQRTDGRGLDDIFDVLLHGPQVSELIALGFLSRFLVYAPALPDLTGVKTVAGDYNEAELSAAMDKPTITGDAIEHFLRLADQRFALTYCVNIQHAEHTSAAFNTAGVPTSVLHSKLSDDDQIAAVNGLRTGEIRNLVSVGMISEGFDVPAVTCAILLRPTKSLVLACQQWGRANRGGSSDPALILDHAGNSVNPLIGHPETERAWTLAGRDKAKRGEANTVSVVRCRVCFCVYEAGPAACPNCGAVNVVVRAPTKQVKGELVEFTGPADTPEKLRAMAKAKGYRPGYIIRLLAAREGCSLERAAIKLGYHPGIVQHLRRRVS
jgi:DNA repair protein RadD